MLRKVSLLVVLAVFGLGLMAFAGCGDDEESESSGTPTTETTETTTEEPSAEPTEAPSEPPADEPSGGTEAPSGDTEVPADVIDQAVTSCRMLIASVPSGGAADPAELEASCDKIADATTVQEVQDASKQVCRDIINKSVPADTPADVKKQALAACDSVGG